MPRKSAARSKQPANPPPKGWIEIPSTAATRWWCPGLDSKSTIAVIVKEKHERSTQYGDRCYYTCTAVERCEDESDRDPAIEAGQEVIIWESAGLRDLARFIGGGEVRIEPVGKIARARIYRFYTRPGQNAPSRGKSQQRRTRPSDSDRDDEGEAAE